MRTGVQYSVDIYLLPSDGHKTHAARFKMVAIAASLFQLDSQRTAACLPLEQRWRHLSFLFCNESAEQPRAG